MANAQELYTRLVSTAGHTLVLILSGMLVEQSANIAQLADSMWLQDGIQYTMAAIGTACYTGSILHSQIPPEYRSKKPHSEELPQPSQYPEAGHLPASQY